MGLFQWLGKLLDDLISWLGRAVAAFLQAFVSVLEAIWQAAIATVGTGQLKRDRRICVFFVGMKWAFQYLSPLS